MPPKNVFLSSPDPTSDALADFRLALMKIGFKVFTNDGIPPDSDLARREIAIADCVVVGLVGTATMMERFHKEIDNAHAEKKQIIVAQLEDADIPPSLQQYAIIDLRNNYDMGLQLISIALSGKLQANFGTPSQPISPLPPITSTPKPTVPNVPPKRIDAPISPPKPITASSSGSPISQDGANPATVIAVMFAIVVIGFVVLSNLPLGGGGRSSLQAVSVTERQISSTLVEFSTPFVRITLPNTWRDNTNAIANNTQWQALLGVVDARTTRALLQMGLVDRETDNILVILRLPMNNQPLSLAELQAGFNQVSPQSGMTILETRLRSYGFGDALFVAAESGGLYQYMVINMNAGFMYMVIMTSNSENANTFHDMLRRLQITNTGAPA
ncbi:MAG: hypothetical protein CUN52_07065 [Phototrophicales bacterium]|nr:MAG: hypothetical protein CUN52_07065 [Phototrophicales bacterium]